MRGMFTRANKSSLEVEVCANWSWTWPRYPDQGSPRVTLSDIFDYARPLCCVAPRSCSGSCVYVDGRGGGWELDMRNASRVL